MTDAPKAQAKAAEEVKVGERRYRFVVAGGTATVGLALSALLAKLGEPWSCWFWGDVLGVVVCG